MVGSVVLSSILAVDADQPGPYSTVQYSILPGPHSVKRNSYLRLGIASGFFYCETFVVGYPGCPRIFKQLGRCFSAKKSTRL